MSHLGIENGIWYRRLGRRPYSAQYVPETDRSFAAVRIQQVVLETGKPLGEPYDIPPENFFCFFCRYGDLPALRPPF